MFRALVLDNESGAVTPTVRDVDESELPAGNVRVRVAYSSLNYKDGMVIRGLGKLVRSYPHVPGIDLAGTVELSDDARFSVGDRVVCTGYRMGELHWGGYAQVASLDADWLVSIPDGLDEKSVMAIGTAGLAAMYAIHRMEHNGLAAGSDVLVTGAGGGVGSVAIHLLESAGYRVAASTGRAELHDYLRELGASEIVERADLEAPVDRPLAAGRWDGCIDNVGSTTLANVLSQMQPGGCVASVGLAGGPELNTTVIPLLLRGVSLLGVDTNDAPIETKRTLWQRLAEKIDTANLDAVTTVEPLERLPQLADDVLAGRVRGRVVIDVNA